MEDEECRGHGCRRCEYGESLLERMRGKYEGRMRDKEGSGEEDDWR
jgi:hypothetical protein